ncbi:LPS export ABC transporter periplasmic protein LptC [Limibacter armeniacum]|uniref:LPS export ABC transporter periplasmic protein LptC n=1 Tax=Limibacter armeniacum TaxID=466084 RepID=UPI002FE6419D
MKKLTFFILIIAAGITACSTTKKKDDLSQKLDPNAPEYMAKNATTIYTEDTKLKMKMEAKVQMRFTDGNERYPEGIFITTFNQDGKEQSTLVADSAIYFYKDHLYRAMGNVVLNDKNKGQKLETNLLNFNNESGDIFTDDSVKITTEGATTFGVGMKANQNDPDDYEIQNITGTISE